MGVPPDPQGRATEGSMRDAGAALAGLIGTRIELLGVELRQEAMHIQRMLVLGVIAAFCLGGTVVLAGILVAAAFWDSHRLLALGVVTLFYATTGAALLMRLRSSISRRPLPFDATVRELEADLHALREVSASRGQ